MKYDVTVYPWRHNQCFICSSVLIYFLSIKLAEVCTLRVLSSFLYFYGSQGWGILTSASFTQRRMYEFPNIKVQLQMCTGIWTDQSLFKRTWIVIHLFSLNALWSVHLSNEYFITAWKVGFNIAFNLYFIRLNMWFNEV